MIPKYLQDPNEDGYTYGMLSYDVEKRQFCLEGDRQMLMMARRLFPGSNVSKDMLKFENHRRIVGDLNWLLLRFPVQVKDDLSKQALYQARTLAIAHAERRDQNQQCLSTISMPPTFVGDLFPYQQIGASFMVKNQRTLLADGMGLGKTWTSLAATAIINQYPVLVVCQTQVIEQWQQMIGYLFRLGDPCFELGDPWDIASHRGQKIAEIVKGLKPYELSDKPFVICHYGLLAAWKDAFLERNFQVLIFDEVQELRHTGTQKYSAASLLSDKVSYAYGLSGTPIFGYGSEIHSVVNAIDFQCIGSF
jgi:SNF2 family DNA or RNA helicase